MSDSSASEIITYTVQQFGAPRAKEAHSPESSSHTERGIQGVQDVVCAQVNAPKPEKVALRHKNCFKFSSFPFSLYD